MIYIIAIIAAIVIWFPARSKLNQDMAFVFAIMTGIATIYGGSKTGSLFLKIEPEEVTSTNLVFRCQADTNLVGEVIHYQTWQPAEECWAEAGHIILTNTNIIHVVNGCYIDSGSNRYFRAFIQGRP